MTALFSESIMELRYYWLIKVELDGIPLVVSRTGWSSELGYKSISEMDRLATSFGKK
jgi:aminomethyltransferase